MRTYSNSIVVKFDTYATGNAGSGKLVTVFKLKTIVKADLFNVDGVSIANPVQADDEGNYTFTIADGYYDIFIDYGLPTQTSILNEQIAVISSGGGGGGDGVLPFDTITLALASTSISNGDTILVRDMLLSFSASKGLGGKEGTLFKVVLTATVTPNGEDIRISTGNPLLSIKLLSGDDVNMSSLGLTTSGFNRANEMLTTGNNDSSGGIITLPTGKSNYTSEVVMPVDGTNSHVNRIIEGKGKQVSVMDFTDATSQRGLVFEGGHSYSVRDCAITKSRASGLTMLQTPVVYDHVLIKDMRIFSNLAHGIDAERGFMTRYEGVFATNNTLHGQNHQGRHTSTKWDTCFATSNGASGFKLNLVTYSTMLSCGSDFNGQYGYHLSNCYAFVTQGSGCEENDRAGWFVEASDADGTNNYNVHIDSVFAKDNNASNTGWANLLHMRCDVGRENTVTLTNSRSNQTTNDFGLEDVIVDGQGSFLVEGYNDLVHGMKSVNRGYIQHLPKVHVLRDFSVSTLQAKNLIELESSQGHNSSYGCEILITASNVDPSDTSAKKTATYKLLVVQGSQGAGLITLGSVGDITGDSTSSPSFTWEMVANQLRLTPVVATAGNFFFEIWIEGFAKVKI